MRSVDPSAIPSNLPIPPSKRADVAHPHHSCSKITKKLGIVLAVSPDQRILRPVVEELLVGVK